MLTFFTIILTVVLVLDCLVLGLLVLIQLPKKEAGLGVAFGGGATDALFGAGSGNALTKLTKYTAAAFFVLIIVLQILKVNQQGASTSDTKKAYEKLLSTQPAGTPSTTTPAAPTTSTGETPAAAPVTNSPILLFNTATNAAPAASNAPAAPAK